MRQLLTDLRGNPIFFSSHLSRFRRNSSGGHRGGNSSSLFFFVENQLWRDVLVRIKKHPQEVVDIRAEDGSGNTPLHVACRLDPPADVIRALKDVSRVKNAQGATPLHIAASHQMSAEALHVLLECAAAQQTPPPSSSSTTTTTTSSSTTTPSLSPTADLSRMGRAPIHYACMAFRALQMDAFKILLEATLKDGNIVVQDPTLLGLDDFFNDDDDDHDDDDDDDHHHHDDDQTQTDFDMTNQNDDHGEHQYVTTNVMKLRDSTGETPLGLLFRRYRERMRMVISTIDRLRRENHDSPDKGSLAAALTVHAEMGELWAKARYTVARLTQERLEREGVQWKTEEMDKLSPVAKAAATFSTEQCKSRTNITYSRISEVIKAEPPHSPPTTTTTTIATTTTTTTTTTSTATTTIAAARARHMDIITTQQETQEHHQNHQNHHHQQQEQEQHHHHQHQHHHHQQQQQQPYGQRQFRIVHASVGLIGYGCPPEMIRLAISIHPNQVHEMDEDGNLPLHIAATASSYLAKENVSNPTTLAAAAAAAAAAATDDDSITVVSDAAMSFFSSATVSKTSNAFDKVIKILLQHYPAAATIPQGRTGRLPLVMAVEAGQRTWNDGIRTLLNAYPSALHHHKIPIHIYPIVLSLITTDETDKHTTVSDKDHHYPNNDMPTRTRFKPSRKRNANNHKNLARLTTLYQVLQTKPDWFHRLEYPN